MPKLAGHRTPKTKSIAITSALSAAAFVALLSGCSSPQHGSTLTGNPPAPTIWTPKPAQHETSAPENAPVPSAAIAHLKGPDGTEVAIAKFEFSNGFATVTIETSPGSPLKPGFHGVHVHKVGKCEANSFPPGGVGTPDDFASAGGHLQVPGHSGEPASGDLTSLQVRKDGSGTLVTTTDAFTMENLLSGDKTAIIIHAGADNFGNIPKERYSGVNGAPVPDETTMNTGDAGKRVACGVINPG